MLRIHRAWLFCVLALAACVTGDPPAPASVCRVTADGACSCTANQEGVGNAIKCPTPTSDKARTRCCAEYGWPELSQCRCYVQPMHAECKAGSTPASCTCQPSSDPSTGTCPKPSSIYTLCCQDATRCGCFAQAVVCPFGSKVGKCDAPLTGGCTIDSSGQCLCAAGVSALATCGTAPPYTCCLDATTLTCSCGYGAACTVGTKVPGCDTSVVEEAILANPRKPSCREFSSEKSVDQCGPISQRNF